MTKRKKRKSGKRQIQAAFRLHPKSGFYVVDPPTNSAQITLQRVKEIEAEMDLEMIKKHTSGRPD
jgi:hypothetical protein